MYQCPDYAGGSLVLEPFDVSVYFLFYMHMVVYFMHDYLII